MILILIIGFFILFVISICIKSSNCYFDYNQPPTEIPAKYHMDDNFMVYNYMEYLQNKDRFKCITVQHPIKDSEKRPVKHSVKHSTSRNSNLKVIRGNKKR